MSAARRIGTLAQLLGAVVLSGVLVACVLFPVVGGLGVTARDSASLLDALPVELTDRTPPGNTVVLAANGEVITGFYDENRAPVTPDRIAGVMKQAMVAIEDARFYSHNGLDVQGTLRAAVTNVVAGEVAEGGSTLTQQLVKQTLLQTAETPEEAAAATEQTLERKLREARLALALEQTYSKDEILTRYLNIVYFGQNAYGVQAAARIYFSVDAADLTLPQAAMLAGLVQNPNGFDPVTHPAAGIERRNVVLDRMGELGNASASAVAKAKKTKFAKDDVETLASGCQSSELPFICDYVRRTVLQMPSLGKTDADRLKLLMQGGLTIRTGIDPDVQKTVQDKVSNAVGAKDPVIAAMDMIEPGTGRIVAMAQSRPVMGSDTKKGQTYWNYSAPRDLGGNQGFQAGSTFKAFTAAAALENDIPLSKRYDARASMDFSGDSFESCSGTKQIVGDFPVKNSTGVNGSMDMYRAAEFSVNTYFVQLALDVGMCDVTKMAAKLGVESNTPDMPISAYDELPSFTLGTAETNPLSVANAYATFASGGIHCDPVIVTKITDSSGKNREVPGADCKRVISSDVASAMDSLLSSVVTKGTGSRARTADGRPQAGKTGTIDSNAAVWYVGYTPQIAGAAMISIDNERKAPRSLKGYTVRSSGIYLEGSGSGDAGRRIWKPVMDSYLQDISPESFPSPPSDLVRGNGSTNDRFGPDQQQPGGR